MNIGIRIIVIIYLLYESYQDIKFKSISIISVIAFVFLGIVINAFTSNISMLNMMFGVFVGVLVAIIGKLMKDGIGAGDGLILSSIGILIGGKSCLLVFLIAITISSIFAILLLVLKKVNLKQRLPFVPYIFCAYLLQLL